ncbi:MAG: LIM domain-containing protein [candidate division KSB1 bacterium]|nr:LIM domain-containing protein [candidate division KSB1 bacterium]MDZ7302610.1 LIM domain-containing protein [candidate division KSB1 bacterium]MDZ7311550.1 LIM domain-containing protein [candidate division KSB1 bacterium]
MAKTCSRCGKELSFRDSFVWEGKPICGACLKEARGVVQSGAVSTATETLYGVRGWLLYFVIGCFLSVLVNIGYATSPGNQPAVIAFDLILALLALITGIMLIAVRNKNAVYMARFFAAFYLVGALILALDLDAPEMWVVFGRAILVNLIWQTYFFRSKRVLATYYHISPVVVAPAIRESVTVRRYSDLFDRQRHGLNFYVGVGFLLASILAWFTWDFVALFFEKGRGFSFLPLQCYPVIFVLVVLEAAVFLLLSYLIRNEWLLPLLFGLTNLLLGICRRAIFNALQLENISFGSTFSPIGMVFGFFWAFLFMLGLMVAVRLWGPQLWSLMLGIVLALLIHATGMQIFHMLTREGFSFNFVSVVAPILDGIIFSALIYAGLRLHLGQKGFWLQRDTIVPKTV